MMPIFEGILKEIVERIEEGAKLLEEREMIATFLWKLGQSYKHLQNILRKMSDEKCCGRGRPCLGDNDNPYCKKCTSNTSNPNYIHNPNWEWESYIEFLKEDK